MPEEVQKGTDIDSTDFAYSLHALADALLDEDGGAYASNIEVTTKAPKEDDATCELTIEYRVTHSDSPLLDPIRFR